MHSNGQLRTERDGDTERGCQKPVVQQKTTEKKSRVKGYLISKISINLGGGRS